MRFLVQRALNAFNAASAAILAATGPSGLSERFVGRRPASVFDGSDVTLELVGRLREREVALGAVSIAPDDTPARRSGLRDAVRENLAEFQRRLAEAWTSTLGSDLAAAEMSLVLEVRDDPFLASLALRCGAPVPSHVIAAVAPLRTVLPPPCPETAGVRALEACEGARQPYLASFRRCLDRFAALASRLGR